MITHHPSAETMLRLAAGTLPAGLSVVVRAHLENCPSCRDELRTLEALGGALLEELAPVTLDERAFNQVLARLHEPAAPVAPRPPRQASGLLPKGMRLPAALKGADIGRWVWVGWGIHHSRVRLPWAPEQNMMMFRVGSGRRVLHHSHGGAEFTQILAGAFSDETGHYVAGDIAETDETVQHQPVAGPDGCICLAALEGGLRFPWLDRLLHRG